MAIQRVVLFGSFNVGNPNLSAHQAAFPSAVQSVLGTAGVNTNARNIGKMQTLSNVESV